ncbi:hypothetical protein ACFQ3S_00675 [Mucilaginibacter terrae]|uniref:hypothetical protein n=1 Tax=Mucilaginibacter terrae TaxID=1955052 RepID=UPI003629EC81
MKNFILPKLIALLCILIATSACKKEIIYQDKKPGQLEAIATVINTGSPALDGCGWLIKVGTVSYSPDNLPENFKESGINVKIEYTVSDADFVCGWGQKLKYMHLYDIKR